MSYNVADIAFEADGYFVLRVKTGFEVYKTGITHATRCASIGFKGDAGLARAKAEIDRRAALAVSERQREGGV